MTRLYLVRHGETEWNRENRTQGCGNDLSLSHVGISQAKAVAERFKNVELDAIYCSDLKRAYQTALEISKVVGLPVNIATGLREMNFGCWEGLTSKEIQNNYKEIHEIWSANPKNAVIPQGETIIQLEKRLISTVNDIILKHQGKNILLVSHGMSLRVLIFSIIGLDISFQNRIRLHNTSVSIIDCYERYAVLSLLNDICHLGR